MSDLSIDRIAEATEAVKSKLAKDPSFEQISVLKNKRSQADDSVGNVFTFDHIIMGARFTVSTTISARSINKDLPLKDEVEDTLLILQKAVSKFLNTLIETIKPTI